ncbi:AAA family ATPase [Nostoc favosum]|uniref:AAA family ATPase n=1 Tax=Nostoc favosum TaxID=2907819 RepID=UPI001E2B9BE9|nr:AAA family ATPase [Nostoc favosum]
MIADGGVGKTKWLYDLLHCIASGKNWNGFPATADSRRVLIYQGDESKHDMLQALNKRGFRPGTEVRQRTAVRFGWNTDAMPILYEDAAEFQPAIVMIDSLTFANRYSLYDENRTEYSRCVLELNKFAAETGITVVIIHHTNKNGGSRGTTSIRNAVSEVIKLEKDTNPNANPQEKILTIEKSRSRRFPASYRLFFNEEDFSFSLLEEVGQELGSPDNSTKDRIIKFLQEHANIKYEAEEVAHYISTSPANARRCLLQLARDGIVTLDEKSFRGTSKLYYIARESEDCSTENPLPSVTIESSPWHNSENGSKACQKNEILQSSEVYNFDCTTLHNYMHNSDAQLLNISVSHVEEVSQPSDKGVVHLSMLENEKKPELQIEEKTQINHAQLHNSVIIPENDCLTSTSEGDEVVQGVVHEVVHEICNGDCDRLDDNSDILQSLPPSPLKRDNFQEKGIYWSPRLNNQVMVWKLFKSLPEAEVYQAGNPTDKIRVKLSELYPLPEFKVSEEVAVLDEHKKFKDRVFTISAVHSGGIWIEGKTRAGTDCYGPFQPSQLRKLSG